MLNESLLSAKDKEIFLLKQSIQKFKEYDRERKQYYANALLELGTLKGELEELREMNPDCLKTLEKIKDYKKQIQLLNAKISLYEQGITNPDKVVRMANKATIYKKALKMEREKNKKLLRQLRDYIAPNVNNAEALAAKLENVINSLESYTESIGPVEAEA